MMRILALVVLLLVPLAAQEAKETLPVLNEVQKLKLQTSLQHLEITQLRFKLAQDAFQTAQLETQDMLRGLQKPGYTFDLQRMVYVVKAPPAATQE